MISLKKCLQARRQNDSIKVGSWLIFLTAVLLFGTIKNIYIYANWLKTPFELILTGGTDLSFSQLSAQVNIVAISKQTDSEITLDGMPLPLCTLTPQYLFSAYGLSASDGQTIYYNTALRDSTYLLQSSQHAQTSCETIEGTRIFNFIYCPELPSDTPLAVTSGSTASLTDAQHIRVKLQGHDINGASLPGIMALGYTIENETILLSESYEQTLLLTRLRYGMLSIFLSSLAAFSFLRTGIHTFRDEQKNCTDSA